MKSGFRTFAVGAGIAAAMTLAPLTTPSASADPIDNALAALPSGPISCEQASRYWTNNSDYQNRVSQAQTIARFDRRGPQILAALGRVDEAANRCGLKGGANPAPAPSPAPGPAPAHATPAAPAAPGAPVINLAPQGVPTFTLPVANVATVVLPDLAVIAQQMAGQFGAGSSLPTF